MHDFPNQVGGGCLSKRTSFFETPMHSKTSRGTYTDGYVHAQVASKEVVFVGFMFAGGEKRLDKRV